MKNTAVNLIPIPKYAEETGGPFIGSIAVFSEAPAFSDAADLLREMLSKIRSANVKAERGGILLRENASILPGFYRYVADASGVVLEASDSIGILYAVATALQLVGVKNGRLFAEGIRLEDGADKPYRSLMVDTARAYHTLPQLLHLIDVCFFYKVNYFHVHFIDDESYTLPSRAFPNISTPGKTYSEKELSLLNAYAKRRGISIVPEIEAPGHAYSLVGAYPEIFANRYDRTTSAETVDNGGLSDENSLICAGSETAMNALRTMLAEICELFPDSPYIHVGGDEAAIANWNACSVCRDYMKKNGIEDEHELYSDFIARVTQCVLDLGRTPIVWEGFPVKGTWRIPKETVVCAWESHYQMPDELLSAGFRIINGSWQPLYIVRSFDRRWNPYDILKWDVYNWQHWWTESAAHLNPFHIPPTDAVLGAQVSSWVNSYEREISFIIENLGAMSERTWSVRRYCSDEEYVNKYRNLVPVLNSLLLDR